MITEIDATKLPERRYFYYIPQPDRYGVAVPRLFWADRQHHVDCVTGDDPYCEKGLFTETSEDEITHIAKKYHLFVRPLNLLYPIDPDDPRTEYDLTYDGKSRIADYPIN